MKHVRVRLTAGGQEAEIHPMYDLLANAEFVDRATALQWNFVGDALGMLHFVEGDRAAFEQAVSELAAALGADFVGAGSDSFYAYVRCETTPLLREMFEPTVDGEFLVVPPIVYHEDGTVSFSAFGAAADIQMAIEAMPDPMTVSVEAVSGLAGLTQTVETRLTTRQREAIEAALELGYYEIPREADHEAVAEAIGCAPSTAAEHLRKGEAKLIGTLGTGRSKEPDGWP